MSSRVHVSPIVSSPAPCGAATSAGNRRHHNEDALLAGPDWFLVADGMGGHRGGAIASALAIETFARAPGPGRRSVADVSALVAVAHATIGREAAAVDALGMGTTLVGATVVDHLGERRVAVFHVGDSRCYRLADGRLTMLTRDHSHVQELVDAGRLDAADAARHPLRNVVTRALGIDIDEGPDVVVLGGDPGRLLLCSDGLSGELDPRTIGRVLNGIADPQAAADRLVELALAGAARDNVTALVVDLAASSRAQDAGSAGAIA